MLLCTIAACAGPPPASAPTALPTALPTLAAAKVTDEPTIIPTSVPQLATAAPTVVAMQALAPPAIAVPTAPPPFPTRAIGEDTLGNLSLLRTIGFGGALSAAIAPNGDMLAVGTTAGLALFEVPSLRSLRFDPVEGGADEVAFSPDGATIAFLNRQSQEPATLLRRVANDRVLAQLPGSAPQFSPDGQMIATLIGADTRQPTSRLWRVGDGAQIAQIAGVVVAFSPDGRFVATRDSQYLDPLPALQLRSSDGARLFELPGRFAAFSPDGNIVAIAGDTTVELRHLPGGQSIATLTTGATDRVWALAFSADGQQLFVQADTAIETWSVADARRVHSVPSGLEGEPSGVGIFTPDSAIVALPFSLGDGAGMRLIRTADGALVHEELPWQVDVTFDRRGSIAALVNRDLFSNGRVRLVDLADGKTSDLDLTSYQNIAFSPDAQMLAASNGEQVELSRAVDGSLLRVLRVENGPIAGEDAHLGFSPDGKILLLAGSLNIPYGGPLFGARAWNSATGEPVDWQLPDAPPLNTLQAVSVSGSSAYAHERALVLNPAGSDSLTHTLPLTVTALSFSPAGSQLAVGDAGGAVQLLSTQDGEQIGGFQAAGAPPTLLSFSPDGTLLGALRADGSALVWQVGEARPLMQLAVASDDTRLIFTADNQLAISGGPQGVGFYRLADGARLRSLPVGAQDIAIGPRRRVLALLHDGQIQLWGVQ